MVPAAALWDELRAHGVAVLWVGAGVTRTPGWQRAGGAPIRFAPPVMEPAQVAREALDTLGKSPSMIAGFSIDPYPISEKMRPILTRLRPGGRLVVRSDAGTALTVTLGHEMRWVEYGSVVGPGKRVNLPGGELVTSPASVDGVYVADGTLGDADGALMRRLAATPLTLRIDKGRVIAIECPREPSLADAVMRRIRRTNDLDRVGLFNFGVNLGLSEPVGEIFTDQKLPGVHISLGTTFPEKTGATWDCPSWVGFTTRSCDVDLDKLAILRRGHYLV